MLDELVFHRRNLTLIGDKIYNDAELEERLWRKRRITLLPLRKCNQKKQWPDQIRRILGNIRHRGKLFSVRSRPFLTSNVREGVV